VIGPLDCDPFGAAGDRGDVPLLTETQVERLPPKTAMECSAQRQVLAETPRAKMRTVIPRSRDGTNRFTARWFESQ